MAALLAGEGTPFAAQNLFSTILTSGSAVNPKLSLTLEGSVISPALPVSRESLELSEFTERRSQGVGLLAQFFASKNWAKSSTLDWPLTNPE